MAKKKENQTEIVSEQNESIVENLEGKNSELAENKFLDQSEDLLVNESNVLEPIVLDENQTEIVSEQNESIVEPLKPELIDTKTQPVQQFDDGRVQVKGAHFAVNVSSKTAEIISKFR